MAYKHNDTGVNLWQIPAHSSEMKEVDLHRVETYETVGRDYSRGYGLERLDTGLSHGDLIGKSELGQVKTNETIITPAPTQDPRDPLNLPRRRKMLACFFLCLFGAMAAAAELILGSMLPIFVLEYAGIDAKFIEPVLDVPLPAGTNPLSLLVYLPGPPIEKVYLLGSLPVLMIGLSNLFMVPLATAIGRRPVVLACGVLAICGAVWAGHSHSLDSHLAARCLQALGAGTVESLIPFIIADMTFSHERNSWIAWVFAGQGFVIVGLGFATPTVIFDLSWRWLYFITATGAGIFLLGVFAFLPETRYHRSADELHGVPRSEFGKVYTPRSVGYDLALFSGGAQWKQGWNVLTNAMRTLFYPQILFITLLNGCMIAATFAAGYTVAEPLLCQPWAFPFKKVTLCLIPVLLASFATVFITGRVGDMVSNWGASRRADGKRVPEDQLLNLILPAACGITGCFLYGVSGEHPETYSWLVFLVGLAMMAFGFQGANTVGAVYVMEVYPEMSGAALLNIASIRYIVAFVLSFRIAEWIIQYGYFISFIIYAAPMALFACLIPLLWYFGPSWKKRFPGHAAMV